MSIGSTIVDFLTVKPQQQQTIAAPAIVRSQVPSTKDAAPAPKKKSSGKANVIKALLKPLNLALDYNDDFQAPEIDFTIIDTAYDTESYVRQGLDKYIDFMFKAGWKFTGKNEATTEYIKQRFQWMAEVTKIPTETFFLEYAEDVVKYSNAVIAKARMKDQTQIPQGVNIAGIEGKQPVAGYYLLNVTTMEVKRDKNGTPKQWQQKVPGQDKEVKFKGDDIIHTYYKRKKGAAFAVPFLIPVLDDIRALRQVEDNILRNLYRNVFPFYHVAVGTPEAPADDAEVDAMTRQIENMSTEGGLVTSERVAIKPVAADQVVDAHPYLKHHEERVFTGLGVPATMFGRGSTANKSTSDNQAKDFIDRCKAFNRLIAADVNEHMVKELLYEGGFDPVMNPDDMVYFQFEEIDVDMMIKQRNEAIYEYEHNAITEDEMRVKLGMDPVADAEREKMHLQIVTLTQLEVAAKLSAQESKSSEGSKGTNNKVNPQNQHTKNARPVADAYKDLFGRLQDDIDYQLNELFDADNVNPYSQDSYTTIARLGSLIDTAYQESLFVLQDCTPGDSLYSPGVLAGINQQMFDDIRSNVFDIVRKGSDDGKEAISSIDNLFSIISSRVELTFSSNFIKRSG